jgi:hypothetical protein
LGRPLKKVDNGSNHDPGGLAMIRRLKYIADPTWICSLLEAYRCGRLQTKADCAAFNGTTGKSAGLNANVTGISFPIL